VPEGNTSASAPARMLKVRRSPQAMACRKRDVEELGKPQRLPLVGKIGAGYAGIETRKGKPGHRVSLKPKRRDGRPRWAGGEILSKGKPAACRWGVLSGIVLRARESRVHASAKLRRRRHGEGPDGSTQPAKETYLGHVGPTKEANLTAGNSKQAAKCRLRGSEYNRGTGCGKTARPGLCGGCRVTGIPTAEER
jgi:hypothetical protein